MGKFSFLVHTTQDRVRMQVIVSVIAVIIYLFGTSGVIYVIERGSDGSLLEKSKDSQWTYLNAVYFSAATLCTVGYGDFIPISTGGKIFLVFQTLLGIGIMGFGLATLSRHFVYMSHKRIGEVLTRLTKTKKKQPNQLSTQFPEEVNEVWAYIVKKFKDNSLMLLALIIYLTMVLTGAAIFNALEENEDGSPWGYGNAVYFCVITLATIGYGDYAPQTDGGKIFFIIYIFLGFGILSFIITELAKRLMKQITKKVEKTARRTIQLSDLAIEETGINLAVSPKTADELILLLKDIVHKYKLEVAYELTDYAKIHEELTTLCNEFDE